MSTVTDVVFLTVMVGLWLAIFWHRAQARVVGELWWSCVCLGVIVTFKVGVIANPFNRVTGGLRLDELIIHLVGVVMVTLTVSWLVLVRFGTRQVLWKTRWVSVGVMLVVLTATWFLAPIYDMPMDATWLTEEVRLSPLIAIHWLIFHLYLVAFCGLFVALASPEARDLPSGYARTSIRLLIAAATTFGLLNILEMVNQVLVLTAGILTPPLMLFVMNMVTFLVFGLFMLAVAIPLVRRRGGGPGGASAENDARVDSLWRWIQSSGSAGPDASALSLDQAEVTVMDQIIDIRDHMWRLQRWVAPADIAAAGSAARRRGLLVGTQARAYVTAACLQLALTRRAAGAEPVAPPPGNLARLGGGRTIAQEANWFAAVYDAIELQLAPSLSRHA